MELNREQIIKALDWLDSLVGNSNDNDMAMFTYQLLGILYDTCEELTEENERLRANQEWISVAERLPDNHRAVLVVCKSTSISGGAIRAVGSYGGGLWSLAAADGTLLLTKYMQFTVTHWTPLPEAPKMKGGE